MLKYRFAYGETCYHTEHVSACNEMHENLTPKSTKTFAARIKDARKKRGLSQPKAAAAWGFNFGTLRYWEEGRRNPFGLYREKLEQVLSEIEAS